MPESKRTATVHLSRRLHRQLKVTAAHDGVSIQDWIASALEAELARRPAMPRVSRPRALSPELRDLLALREAPDGK